AVLLRAEGRVKDAGLRDELRAVRATVLFFSGQPGKAMAIASDILQRPSPSERACVAAAMVAVPCLGGAGRGDEAVAIAERWTETAGRVPNALLSVPGWLLRWLPLGKCSALVLEGRRYEAEALAREEYQAYLAKQVHEGTAVSALQLGLVALARGHVQPAGQWLREAAALFRAPTAPNFLSVCLASLASAAALAGDLPAADAALAEAEEALTPGMAVFRPGLELSRAWIAATRGEVSRARSIALGVADR